MHAYSSDVCSGGVRPGPGGCPDFEEGPRCLLAEDEFYDAVDAEIEKMEIEERKLQLRTASTTQLDETPRDSIPRLLLSSHPVYVEVRLCHCHSSLLAIRLNVGYKLP